MAFFDDTLRVGRIPDLLNKARIQREFERTVVADVPQQIEKQVQRRDRLDGGERAAPVAGRRRARQEAARQRTTDRVVGGDTSGFQYDRARLIDTVGRRRKPPCRPTTRSARRRQWPTACARPSPARRWRRPARSPSARWSRCLPPRPPPTSPASSPPGAIAVLGMFVIPSKRAQAKADLRRRIAEMRDKLMERPAHAVRARGRSQRPRRDGRGGALHALCPRRARQAHGARQGACRDRRVPGPDSHRNRSRRRLSDLCPPPSSWVRVAVPASLSTTSRQQIIH